MKLRDLHEARYHQTSEWIDWVRSAIDRLDPGQKSICLSGKRNISYLEHPKIQKEFEQAFGPGYYAEDEYTKLHDWQWKIGQYKLELFTWGANNGKTGMCVRWWNNETH